MEFCIIEHATRGVFLGWEYDYNNSSLKEAVYKPKFSYTCSRSDEKVKRYYGVMHATREGASAVDKAVADVERLAKTKIGRAKCVGAYVLRVTMVAGKVTRVVDLIGQRR